MAFQLFSHILENKPFGKSKSAFRGELGQDSSTLIEPLAQASKVIYRCPSAMATIWPGAMPPVLFD